LDKRIVFAGGMCFSVGVALFVLAWSLGGSGYAIWVVLLALIVSGIGFVIFSYGATAGLFKPEWVYQETPGYQKWFLKALAYLGLALGLLVALMVIAALVLFLLQMT